MAFDTAARQDAASRFGRREAYLAAAVALVGVPFGLLLHQVVRAGPLTQLDERSARWLNARANEHDPLVWAMRAVTLLGSTPVLVAVVGVALVWLLRRHHLRLASFLGLVTAGGGLINTVVKLLVGRPRPELDEPLATAFGKSFPSGHAMSSLVCFGALLVVFLPLVPRPHRRGAVAAAGLLVATIGLSRLVLGVHFLSDVLGGYVLGAAWLIGSVAMFEIWRDELGRRPTDALSDGIEPELTRG